MLWVALCCSERWSLHAQKRVDDARELRHLTPANLLPLEENQKIHLFEYLFAFFLYLALSGANYCEKGRGRCKNVRGGIGKPMLELLTFWDFRKISSRDQVGC